MQLATVANRATALLKRARLLALLFAMVTVGQDASATLLVTVSGTAGSGSTDWTFAGSDTLTTLGSNVDGLNFPDYTAAT